MTDPIADMLTRIRNAQAVQKIDVVMPFSNMKLKIAEILKNFGYITDFETTQINEGSSIKQIRVVLKYKKPHMPAMMGLTRISTPGRRVYVNKDNLPKVLNNLGIAIISTSQGLMTADEARKRKLGGELICEIY